MYRGLVAHARRVLMGYFDLVRVCKGLKATPPITETHVDK